MPESYSGFEASTPGTPPLAVVSYARFRASFSQAPEDRQRFSIRLQKQLLSSLGNALGLPKCADPRCVRAYPKSLEELDAKGADYCDVCREGVSRALGSPLPAAPAR